MPELVVHGVRGFVGGTDEDLARFVRDVRGIDRVACRRRAEERYSVERMVADYEALYRSLLER
jgi:glycosyltransferase involved in cell wall biosynthesis